jgi:hypothetical protein
MLAGHKGKIVTDSIQQAAIFSFDQAGQFGPASLQDKLGQYLIADEAGHLFPAVPGGQGAQLFGGVAPAVDIEDDFVGGRAGIKSDLLPGVGLIAAGLGCGSSVGTTKMLVVSSTSSRWRPLWARPAWMLFHLDKQPLSIMRRQ